jgi:hypothetical protein
MISFGLRLIIFSLFFKYATAGYEPVDLFRNISVTTDIQQLLRKRQSSGNDSTDDDVRTKKS